MTVQLDAPWGLARLSHKDSHGRGTHLAAIVAGRKYGVAKEAKVVAVKIAEDPDTVSPPNLIEGLHWVTKRAPPADPGKRPDKIDARSIILIGPTVPYSPSVNRAVEHCVGTC